MEFELKNWIFLVIFLAAVVFFAVNAAKLIKYLKIGKPDNRFDRVWERIKQTLLIAFAQTKILRDKQAGPIHAGIFWGFLILLFSALNAIFVGFGIHHPFNFLGPVFTAITILTDIFCVAIVIAIIWALQRRFIAKVKRLQINQEESRDAAFILGMIFFIVTALLLENASQIAMNAEASWAVRPVSAIIADLIPVSAAPVTYETGYWIHLVFILVFLNYLPYSKHLHVLTSVPNVFFSKIGPVNRLDPIDFEEEGVEKFGIVDVEDVSWKTIFDGYTCTHCGRCTSVCPANVTGKVLDPREIIVKFRERTMDKAPIVLKKKVGEEPSLTEEEQQILDKKFVGEYENIEALWQCTTCGACMQECPVMIEHVPAIVGMRRSLVMMEADFPQELQNTFGNMENNSTPWAFSPMERADWAEGTGIKTAAENPGFDILFWVGCAGSFDDRAKKISLAFAKLMQAADVNFAILGTEEQCNGDVARRTGHEYLADMMIKANIETLKNYDVKKIVTTCPHCFNIFKNEYPDFGGSYEVIHHTSYIQELIDSGKLKMKGNGEALDITYHDSCYMGRYNNIYDEPRSTLKKVPGLNILEVDRSGDRGLCCGAGGGQMFMEETKGKRVNIERTEELLGSGAKTIAANCPFCMTMLSDGVKAKDAEDIQVKDLAEIILEHADIPEDKKH
ncbi:MAG: heterodisulfide reductase-related iron-sulfur binding cluster [Bacteroidota bacterium]